MLAGSRQGTRYPFSFNGSGGEYFKIWIVNILLSIVTLYIYSAWAKVRTLRYFAGNTTLDNSSFDYHATGMQIFIGRVIAVVLLIIVTVASLIHPVLSIIGAVIIGLLMPWIIWRSVKFNMRMTSFRNVRFGFDGKLGPMYMYLLVIPLVPIVLITAVGMLLLNVGPFSESMPLVITVGVFVTYLMYPWVHKRLANYFLRDYRYGTARFSGELSTGRFYAIYLKAMGLSILIYLLFSLIGAVIAAGLHFGGIVDFEKLFEGAKDAEFGAKGSWVFLGFTMFIYLSLFVFGTMVTAYFRSRLRENLYTNALLDQRIDPESTVGARGLWWVTFSNILLLVFTLGLAYPWTKVRMARYLADNTAAYAEGTLDQFVNGEQEKVGSLGDELGEAFDLGVDVGF